MATFLVTGGAGFIGSHVTYALLQADHRVVVFDSFQCFVQRNESIRLKLRYRMDKLLSGAVIETGDVRNQPRLQEAISTVRPDCIIHAAAMPVAKRAIAEPVNAFRINLLGLFNLLEALRSMPVKLVFVSSSMVYGDFDREPMPEEGPTRPKELYGSLKLMGEILVKAYSNCYSFLASIVRPSAVYGSTDFNRRVLQIFVESALDRKKIMVNDPETRLDFTHVADVAQGLVLAATRPEAGGEIFNITRGEGRSLSEAVDILRQLFPDLEVETFAEANSQLPLRGTLDISKARRLLGYEPKWSLEDGLREYARFRSGLGDFHLRKL